MLNYMTMASNTVFKWTWNFKLRRDLLTSWIIWIPDKSQLNLKYKVWHCWFYIAILHYFVPLVKFPINVLCIVVHLFDFQIVFLFEFVTDLTLYSFFSYSMFLWSTNGYLLLKSCVARIGDNGSWAVATSSSIINSSTTDIDTKVFWSLNLSWL